jgi:hypothetical protein
MKISELLLKYKTDKNYGTIKNIYKDLYTWELSDNPEPYIGHTYGDSYDEIFKKFDILSNLNFLEIGIQKGGSLLAWKDYFINSNIYGVDIVDCILDEYRKSDFNYIISDVKSEHVKNSLKDVTFDIIIDDGSHYLTDVLFVVSNFINKLNPGGVLIIEDCQSPEHWLQEIKKIVPSETFEITTKDLRANVSYDNFLIIIQKNN